ncbi:unnamed protein product [Amaranthus hypochondriacus]
MGLKEELPVFTETNLGTRIALAISPDITAAKFKGEFERAHIGCFPQLGILSVNAVMVKRGSCFYHLPDSLSLKHVFQGFQDTWILYVNASLSDFNNCTRVSQNITDSRSNRQKKFCSKGVALKPTLAATAFKQNKRKRKRKRQSLSEESQSSKAVVLGPVQVATAYPLRKKHKRKKRPIVKKLHLDSVKTEGNILNISNVIQREGSGQKNVLSLNKISDSSTSIETSLESLSGAVSVSGIINKYLTYSIDDDHHIRSTFSSEFTPTNGQCEVEKFSTGKKTWKNQNSEKRHHRLLPSLLPKDLNSVALTIKEYEAYGVGRRLVMASSNLAASKRSAFSKGKQLWDRDAGTTIRPLVFEIGDND